MLKLLIELHGEKRIGEVFPEIKTVCENILIKDFILKNNCLYVPKKNYWVLRYNAEDNVVPLFVEHSSNKSYIYYTHYEFLNIILPKEDLV